MAIQRNPENGKIIAKRFTLAALKEASENQSGFCIACGAERDGCEPDARKYECDECGLKHVYGAEELVLMGRIS